jgi:hypothetical protein
VLLLLVVTLRLLNCSSIRASTISTLATKSSAQLALGKTALWQPFCAAHQHHDVTDRERLGLLKSAFLSVASPRVLKLFSIRKKSLSLSLLYSITFNRERPKPHLDKTQLGEWLLCQRRCMGQTGLKTFDVFCARDDDSNHTVVKTTLYDLVMS